MREILFRGKRLDNGEWMEGYYLHLGPVANERAYMIPSYASALYTYEVDPATVCQFTGEVDKNGKRVFEGDILKMERDIQHRATVTKRETTIGVVRYDEELASFGYESKGHYKHLGLNRFPGDFQEVIGNIHDNPELLEGGQA